MKTRFIAVLLASVFFWTPATQDTYPTGLGAYSHIFTFDFGSKPRVAARRARAISLALERSTFDFDRFLRPQMDKMGVDSIGLRFGTRNFWNEEEYEIVLSDRYGTRWYRDYGGSDTAGMYLHEMGHVVDTFINSQNNENRRATTAAFCSRGHQWWEGTYKNSTGEAFADAFAALYGGGLRPWPRRAWGHHKLTPKVESVIREILEEVP